MSCWRVLHVSDPGDSVPQLLIKPCFGPKSYTVFLTDLSNIWSEELDLAEIVKRASEHESPIEVTTQDTSQLPILLEHVEKSLTSDRDSTCLVTKEEGGGDGVVLHTTNNLPRPLGELTWTFKLERRPAGVLKNELILPLLVSSHIQHERINGLVSSIHEKDRAITRLVDQFESSNMDLSSAFPSLAGAKPGRRLIKREQAQRHIPALGPFQEDEWMRDTSQLKDGHVSTLGLFQEALSQCTPKVPSNMKSEDLHDEWWTSVPASLNKSKPAPKKQQKKSSPPPKAPPVVDDDESETDDEFETVDDLKHRDEHGGATKAPAPKTTDTTPAVENMQIDKEDDTATEEEEDDDDLDAPPKSQSQSQSQSCGPSSRGRPKRTPTVSPAPKSPSPKPKSPSPEPIAPAPKKSKGFRIGGARAKKAEPSTEDEEMPDVAVPTRPKGDSQTTPPKSKKTFKIGGKNHSPTKSQTESQRNEAPRPASPSPVTSRSRSETVATKTPAPPPEEEHEETPEERAERKRLELKRKNEETAKQQAKAKKKKRF